MGAEETVSFKSLAQWKTWWTGTCYAMDMASSLLCYMDPTTIPGKGQLVELKVKGKVSAGDLTDPHTAKVIEGLLHGYPTDKDPSAYFLGDAILYLNNSVGNVILGPPSLNPVNEKARRDQALRCGSNLKMLLSYVRTSSTRAEKGRSPTATYLKELALAVGKPKRSKGGRSSPSSTCSTADAPTLVLGETTSPASTSVEPLGKLIR